jgi:hypothetical protein
MVFRKCNGLEALDFVSRKTRRVELSASAAKAEGRLQWMARAKYEVNDFQRKCSSAASELRTHHYTRLER